MNIESLLDLACATVANMIKGKTPEEIRKTFNIVVCFLLMQCNPDKMLSILWPAFCAFNLTPTKVKVSSPEGDGLRVTYDKTSPPPYFTLPFCRSLSLLPGASNSLELGAATVA